MKELQYFTGITSLTGYLFRNDYIRVVTIPESVTVISGNAFYISRSLHHVIMKSLTPPTITSRQFDMNNLIYVPDEALYDYKNADVWSGLSDRILPMSEYRDQTVYDGIILDKRVGSDGEADSPYYCRTEYIPVVPPVSFTWCSGFVDINCSVILLDSEKNYIDSYNGSGTRTLTFSNPNLAYVVFNLRTSWLDKSYVRNDTTALYPFKGIDV